MLNLLAIAMGGHVRTGLGDLPLWNGAALSNAQMVGKFAAIARDMGREVATAEEARAILGIPSRRFDAPSERVKRPSGTR
jgi:3-keto-5-aminohexanoate cleavage enzyme